MSRPNIEEVVAVEFLNNAWKPTLTPKSEANTNMVLEYTLVADAEDHASIERMQATAVPAASAIGFGVAVATSADANETQLYEYEISAQLEIPDTTGGTKSYQLVVIPCLIRAAVNTDGGTGQLHSFSGDHGFVLPL